jgi:hypothetical protein
MIRFTKYEITDFLVTHYSSGYEILRLGKDLEEIFNSMIVKEKLPYSSDTESALFPLLFEFLVILDAREIFDTFKDRIQKPLGCYELLMIERNLVCLYAHR